MLSFNQSWIENVYFAKICQQYFLHMKLLNIIIVWHCNALEFEYSNYSLNILQNKLKKINIFYLSLNYYKFQLSSLGEIFTEVLGEQ